MGNPLSFPASSAFIAHGITRGYRIQSAGTWHSRRSPDFAWHRDKAKISLRALEGRPQRGKLILVSAITPTPAGKGKTTISIGLAQGLRKSGRSVALALRQPSMGPVFGRKGGATGGGKSTVEPSESINLHFTGDFHAITAAHNLLTAVMDNALYHGTTRLDPLQVLWKRVLDVNDRALRRIRVGRDSASVERVTGFDITAHPKSWPCSVFRQKANPFLRKKCESLERSSHC